MQLPVDTLVLPIDFSDRSMEALSEVQSLVKDASGLHIVHVLPPLNQVDPVASFGQLTDEQRVQRVSDAVREKLPDALATARIHVAVAMGNPANQVAAIAEEVEADLVVTPSHGRTGLARWALGSVAERIVRRCSCPVLVLK